MGWLKIEAIVLLRLKRGRQAGRQAGNQSPLFPKWTLYHTVMSWRRPEDHRNLGDFKHKSRQRKTDRLFRSKVRVSYPFTFSFGSNTSVTLACPVDTCPVAMHREPSVAFVAVQRHKKRPCQEALHTASPHQSQSVLLEGWSRIFLHTTLLTPTLF